MDGNPEQERYPIHGIKIDAFTVSPAVMAGGDHVTVEWATRGAARLELWIDGRPWLCPLSANGSRRIAVARSTDFRLIAGPPRGAWIESHASVMMISLALFVATIGLTTAAIAALWWASQGFLSDVSLIESTPVWRTVGATSRVASFITTLIGLPVIGSLLRLWPGATSSFGVRLLRHRPVAIAWIASCSIAVLSVLSLWRSTETVILSSEVEGTVHFLEPGKDSVALAVPPGVSTAIISRDDDGIFGWMLGAAEGSATVLSSGNRTIPHRVYAERQGEFWILGCWSEVLVRHPPGFQATLELVDGRTVPVDLDEDEDGLHSVEPVASALSVLSRRARVAVADCKRFPTSATLVLRDSVGSEALRLPFPINLPPERAQWAAAREQGRRSVQADIELGIVSMPHSLDKPEDIEVQLSGDEGWRAAQCGRIDATLTSVAVAVVANRQRLEPPLAPPGSASETAADQSKMQARCTDPPTDRYRFVVPLRINGTPTTSALGCAFPATARDPEARIQSRADDENLAWRTTFAFGFSGEPPRLGGLDVCTPTTWDGHRGTLIERQILPIDGPRRPSHWQGTLAAGTHQIVWPTTHWAPGRAELDVPGLVSATPEPLLVGPTPGRAPEDRVRIADRTVDFITMPVWRDRVAEPVGLVREPELLFDEEAEEWTCGFTDATEVVVERSTNRAAQVSVTGFPAALLSETIDAHVRLGDRRLDCHLRAGRPSLTCGR